MCSMYKEIVRARENSLVKSYMTTAKSSKEFTRFHNLLQWGLNSHLITACCHSCIITVTLSLHSTCQLTTPHHATAIDTTLYTDDYHARGKIWTVTSLKPGFHYPSWRPKLTPELTGDRFPLPVNTFPLAELTDPSTRVVETGLKTVSTELRWIWIKILRFCMTDK